MTGPQVLRKVELPAAVPLLMTGVRVSAVQIIATATLGALVGYECLGTYIVAGLARGPPAGRRCWPARSSSPCSPSRRPAC